MKTPEIIKTDNYWIVDCKDTELGKFLKEKFNADPEITVLAKEIK